MEAIGICYLEGSGVEQCPINAREWLMRANTLKYRPNQPPPMERCVRRYYGKNRTRVQLSSALNMADMWETPGPQLEASAPTSWRTTHAWY